MCVVTISEEQCGKEAKEMLSLELIGIFGLLFGFLVYLLVVTQLERRSVRIAEEQAEKAAEPSGDAARVAQGVEHNGARLRR
jgi:hypothetical protein